MFHLRKPDRRAQVIFYAGYRADERPLSFRRGLCKREVREVLSSSYEAAEDGAPLLVFQVRADDGKVYRLAGSLQRDVWMVQRLRKRGRD